MRRNLYTFILSAAFLTVGAGAEVFAQTNEKTQVASINSNFDREKVKEETVEPAAENKSPAAPPSRAALNLSRVGVEPGQNAPLTLNEAIRRALENNNDIEVARNDVRLNEQSLRAFEGFYDPFIGVTPTFTRSSTTGQTARNDFTVNTDLAKNIKVGGGNFRVFYNNQRTENRFQQAQVTSGSTLSGAGNSALFSSALGFSFTQPLWRDRAIDNNRRNIKIQRKRLEQSDADFRQRTIDVISQVQRSYWDLVFALRDQQNRVANLELTRRNLTRVEAQITAGAAAPLARAEVATELANRESDLLLAAQNVTTAENTLKNLILRDPTAPEWSTQLVPTEEPSFDQTPVKLEDALTEAKQNRPELRRLNLQREINDIDIRFFKNQTKPIVDLTSTVYLNGIASSIGQTNPNLEVDQFSGNDELFRRAINQLAGRELIPQNKIPVPVTQSFLIGGFGQSNANLFRSDAPTYQVGVTIQIPVGNRTAKANLASAQIQQTRLDAQTRDTEQQVITEVRNAVQALETARQRVLTARIARENANIQLQGEQKLYEVGRSTTFLLFQRENALANARNAEIRAETDFNKALADLQRATSSTLRSNNIIIESVVAP